MLYRKQFKISTENQSLLVAEAFGIEDGWINNVVDVDLPDTLPQITLITGESGCGKSTLLKLIGKPTESIIPDLPLHAWGNSTEESLELLNYVGLNDASLFVLKYNQLSDSQQARAKMYSYFCRAENDLLIDEFLSTLDRKTAKALAFSFQKIIRKRNIKLIAVTAQDDLIDYLQPDLVISGKAFPSRWRTDMRNLSVINPFSIDIKETNKNAYKEDSLGSIHYKGKYTGGKQQYFCAYIENEIVGWLIGKMIPNSGQLRISRVVVHPTYRGCGIGQSLIKNYVALHPNCDTVAAMARFNPVFEKSGMKRVSDIVVNPSSKLRKEIPLSELEWASREKCFDLMSSEKYRKIIAPYSTTQYVNPGGKLNGNKDRKSFLIDYVIIRMRRQMFYTD